MTPPKTASISPPEPNPLLIELGRYSVRIHADGRRELLLDGKTWLDAQPDTIVWELIDKIASR